MNTTTEQAERNAEIADRLEEFAERAAGWPSPTADDVILLLKAVVALRGHETSPFDDE